MCKAQVQNSNAPILPFWKNVHVLLFLYFYPGLDITKNKGMEYMSLKFPNFADTARIHYASSDLASGAGQVSGAGGWHIHSIILSFYHYHVSIHYIHFTIGR